MEQYQAISHSLAGVLLIAFFAGLASLVRRAGSPTAARVTLAGGTGIGVLMLAPMTLVSSSISLSGEVPGHEQLWIYDAG